MGIDLMLDVGIHSFKQDMKKKFSLVLYLIEDRFSCKKFSISITINKWKLAINVKLETDTLNIIY